MAAVIFDLDDTLYPHLQYVHSGFAAAARFTHECFGLPEAEVYAALRFARQIGHRGREFQCLCEWHHLDSAVVGCLLEIYRDHRPHLSLSPGAATALDRLRDNGWRTAVLTNGIPSVQLAKVGALGLRHLVDHVVCASDVVEGGKPAPEAFVETLRRLNVEPSEAVMVGDDRVNDIEGARHVGLRTILIARAASSETHGADAVVRSLAEVPDVVARLVDKGMVHAA